MNEREKSELPTELTGEFDRDYATTFATVSTKYTGGKIVLRPSIVLKGTTVINGGIGTYINPYTIQ